MDINIAHLEKNCVQVNGFTLSLTWTRLIQTKQYFHATKPNEDFLWEFNIFSSVNLNNSTTSSRYSAMQYSLEQCIAEQFSSVQYNAVQCSAVQCRAMQFSRLQCISCQSSVVRCSLLSYQGLISHTVSFRVLGKLCNMVVCQKKLTPQ